ncbi:MAG TPA: DUF1330 domain-containing protein [Ignavibacteria bacterium]|nr:DUF1330 domain-containing protein [Ignavibacteria bacterium]HMQ97643.1 DUF1330 domain-containing protein [Ignavibacteria bacterium]
MSEITITQLIYLNDSGEQGFLEYESLVLPLLEKYRGKLELRLRPCRDNFIYPAEGEQPYEVHIVSFETKEDYESFKNDPVRIKNLGLLKNSVKKITVMESCG